MVEMMNNSRRSLIEKIYNSGYEKIIEFKVIDAEALDDAGNINNQCNLILSNISDMDSNKLFMHLCPRDEVLNPGYSFAGIYNSYKPLNCRTKSENIYAGLMQLSRDKVSRYANYYYGRNHLKRTEVVDLLISREVDYACGSGTVYVSDELCLGQYFLSPKSYFTREAVKFSSIFANDLIEENICNMARELYEIAQIPLDVEFVIDLHGKVYASELRQISCSHMKNWEKLPIGQNTYINLATCIANSVGSIEGYVVCVDESLKWLKYLENTSDVIFILNSKDNGLQLFLNKIWEKDAQDIKLVINYDEYIIDNHEQYMCYEDSGISFVTKTVNEVFVDGAKIRIVSNGYKNLVSMG